MIGSRAGIGGISIRHKGKSITTTVGSKAYEELFLNLEDTLPFDVGWIPKGFEHRPDLISNVLFGSPANWWTIMQVNMIFSPFEQLNSGDRILIPRE